MWHCVLGLIVGASTGAPELPLIDRTADLPPARVRDLERIRSETGAGDARVLDAGSGPSVLALVFESERAMVSTAERLPEYAWHGRTIFVASADRTDDWGTLVRAVEARGGAHRSLAAEERTADLAALHGQLRTLRLLVRTYGAMHGSPPDFARSGWDQVIAMDGGVLREAPRNPLSTAPAAATVAVVDSAPGGGKTVDPEDAGWVWDRGSGALFAAGVSDEELDAACEVLAHLRRLETSATRAARLLAHLHALRAQVDVHRAEHGSTPQCPLTVLPENPFCPAEVARTLIVVERPGAGGESVWVGEGGWVWNASDGLLYAGGASDEQLYAAAGSPDPQPQESDEARARSALSALRLEIANYRANRALSGPASWPALPALRTDGFLVPHVPANPFNGSREIQAAPACQRARGVSGTAGWNYDGASGLLWANSDVAGENEY